ncbi:uncharacterized protein TNIN_213431 [Trichonephila inaurata madagascariensis]|uniref:Uncharacterized protein n=1 Tax=Trichonephila inaurata madagascariensis TaxID=2747483 RepID=A0A8X6YS27_9ARAC|nr:uncharacterized protein TNIN_213431 [Trichonephila inaurata madagascariensis]
MPQQNRAKKTETAVYISPFYNSPPGLQAKQSLNSSSSIPIYNSYKLNSNLPILLFSFLSLIGLAQQFSKNLVLRKLWLVFYFVLLSQIMDVLAMSIIGALNGYSFKHNAPYIFAFFCNLMLWHSMRRKKKNLINLLRKLGKLCPATYNKRTNIMVLILFSFPFMYSVSSILVLNITKNLLFYTYGHNMKGLTLQASVVRIKKFLLFLVHCTFPSLVVVLFCYLCLRCSSCFNCLTRKVLHYSPEEFRPSEQIDILRQKAKIDDIIEELQNIFSLPSFFMIVSNLFVCSSILGIILTGIHSELIIVNAVFFCIPNLICIIVVLWVAGGLPVEQHKLKGAYYKRAHSRFLIVMTSEKPQYKKEILDKPDFELNGLAVLFCYLCLRCSFCFNCLTRKVLQYPPEDFGHFEQIDVLRQKAKIDDILENLQNVFTLSSFFAIISHLFSCCSVISKIGYQSMFMLVSAAVYGIPNLLAIIIVLWVARELLMEQNKLKEAFYKTAHSRFLIVMPPDEPQCKREILEKSIFVLNGCSIFQNTRNSILTLVWKLLIFAFIIYQIQITLKKKKSIEYSTASSISMYRKS